MKSSWKFATPVVALLLVGCWSSSAPLMTEKMFDKPPLKGNVTSDTHKSTTTRTRYNISYEGKVAVATPEASETDKTKQYRLSFDLLQKNIYLMQAANGNGALQGYLIAKFEKNGIMKTYNPSCSTSDLALPGVTANSSTCNFSDYDTLLKAARGRAVEIATGNGEGYLYNQYSPTELLR